MGSVNVTGMLLADETNTFRRLLTDVLISFYILINHNFHVILRGFIQPIALT